MILDTTIKEITPAYNKDAVYKSLTEVTKIFTKAVVEVQKKYGYKFDRSLEQKVRPKLQDLLQQ